MSDDPRYEAFAAGYEEGHENGVSLGMGYNAPLKKEGLQEAWATWQSLLQPGRQLLRSDNEQPNGWIVLPREIVEAVTGFDHLKVWRDGGGEFYFTLEQDCPEGVSWLPPQTETDAHP